MLDTATTDRGAGVAAADALAALHSLVLGFYIDDQEARSHPAS